VEQQVEQEKQNNQARGEELNNRLNKRSETPSQARGMKH
jgi:hypothetical protein